MKVGILGGGQLAQMLVEAAAPVGVVPHVMADAPNSPASLVTDNVTVGAFTQATLSAFLSDKTHVLFESEFVDTTLLEKAAEGLAITFVPSLKVMSLFQDKLSQKEFCIEHGLPTAPFSVYQDGDVGVWCQKALSELGGACVFKWATLGYDGKGNFFARGNHDEGALYTFVQSALNRGSRVYAEKLIRFSEEAAIVGVRSISGSTAQYPVVYSVQTQGICLSVKGPAISLGLDSVMAAKIAEIARTIGEKGGIVGTYAVELFLADAAVYVNEIAPRVHNTGHYTQDACRVSQFENHLRACLSLELGETSTTPYFAMQNILGPHITREEVEPPTVRGKSMLHWYGKKGVKPLRKLGHINTVASNKETLEEQINGMIEDITRWSTQISS